MGKLDNTLIIYISGDNGTSAEGTPIGTPNEVASFNGVDVAGRRSAQVLLRRLGHRTRPIRTWRWLDLGVRHAVLVDQADRLALRRHAAGHGDLVAEGHQGQGRHPQPVPPRHRHRADDPRGDRHPARPTIVDGITQKPIEGISMIYTFDQGNANAPSTHTTQYFEMMGDHAIYHDGWIASTKVMRPPWDLAGAVNQDPAGYHVGAVRPHQGLDAVRRRRRQVSRTSSRNWRSCSGSRRRSTRSCRSTPRWRPGSSRRGRASPPAAPSSPGPARSPARRTATRRACSTRRTPSRPRSRFRRAAPRA